MPTRARKRLARHIFNFCSIVAGNRTLSLLSPPRCSAYCLGGTATFFWRFRRTVGHESFQVLLCRDCTLTFTILPLNKSEQAAGSGWRTRSCRVFNGLVRKTVARSASDASFPTPDTSCCSGIEGALYGNVSNFEMVCVSVIVQFLTSWEKMNDFGLSSSQADFHGSLDFAKQKSISRGRGARHFRRLCFEYFTYGSCRRLLPGLS